MKTLVISASMRTQSQSLKVANWLAERSRLLDMEVRVLDLHEFRLPLFDDGETVAPQKEELRALLSEHDAFVFVSPEWNGMMSHGLINMLHYVGQEMAYKPVMLVGVSAGRGGTYPVDQMRLLGQKNRHYVISPEALVVSDVENVFNDDDMSESAEDSALKARAEYGLKVLAQLSQSLVAVRSSGVVDLQTFRNGV